MLGHQVTIFAFDGDTSPKNAEVKFLGAPRSLFLRRLYFLVFPADVIRHVGKLGGFDVILSHHYPMNWLASVAKRIYRVKYVYHAHGVPYPQLFASFHERLYMILFSLLWKKSLSNVDFIIAVSEFLEKEVKKELKRDSVVLYNKVDFSIFHEGVDGQKIRKKYGLGHDPVLLYVGRVDPYKGVYLLLLAYRIIKREMPNAKLLILGKKRFPKYFKKIKLLCDGSTIFVEWVPKTEIQFYYGACDIYCTTSLYESFDLPSVEAQACAKPVVAFDIGAHNEFIDDGNTGFLVPSRNYVAFAEAVVRLLQDPDLARKFGLNGYRRTREKFSRKAGSNSVLVPLLRSIMNPKDWASK